MIFYSLCVCFASFTMMTRKATMSWRPEKKNYLNFYWARTLRHFIGLSSAFSRFGRMWWIGISVILSICTNDIAWRKKNSYTHNSNRKIQFDFFSFFFPFFSARAMRNGLNANKNYDAFLERVNTKRASMQKLQSTMVLTRIISKNYDWIAIKKRNEAPKRLNSVLF